MGLSFLQSPKGAAAPQQPSVKDGDRAGVTHAPVVSCSLLLWGQKSNGLSLMMPPALDSAGKVMEHFLVGYFPATSLAVVVCFLPSFHSFKAKI